MKSEFEEKITKLQCLKEANDKLRKANEKLFEEVNSFPTQETSLLNDFMNSFAFHTGALAMARLALQGFIYTTLTALSLHYPFQLEKLGFKAQEGDEVVDISGYTWDRETNRLINSEGESLEISDPVSDLTNIKLKHPWEGHCPYLMMNFSEMLFPLL